ncbi:MAG: gamma-glutamylcyclotransferase family protein [Planctomycetota bacterium]|jgi:gamma-glutamylcyclotransferase (GGCT)/AIG2-like uncharacterized protein YtfP
MASKAEKKRKKRGNARRAAKPAPARKRGKKRARRVARPIRTLYFAYGSNMDHSQMDYRCPNARFVQRAAIPRTRLVFRAGLADVVPAEDGDFALGAIWEVTRGCVEKLDRYEGYPHLYVKDFIRVRHDGEVRNMMVYRMRDERVGLRPPSSAYLSGIARGYVDCGWEDKLDALDFAVDDAHEVWDSGDRVQRPIGRAARGD